MSDGVFGASEATVKAQAGIAAEAQVVRDDMDAIAGDPLCIVGKRFDGLAPAGLSYKMTNLLDHVSRWWPQRMLAYDDWPSAGNNEPIGGGETVSSLLQKELHRRRRLLASRYGVALVTHWAGDPAPTEADAEAAMKFRDEHRDDPPEIEQNPLIGRGVTAWQDAGIAMDESSGVGVRLIGEKE